MAEVAWSGGLAASGAAGLRDRHAELAAALAHNQFHAPLYLESKETPQQSEGDLYAVADFPFATVSSALNDPTHWCDVLILHLNTKYCRAKTIGAVAQLDLRIGKKYDQPVADASELLFAYRSVAATPQYFDIELNAPSGPFGTNHYTIVLEAIPIEGDHTLLHLGYAFGYSAVSHMALQVYLATIGSGKVGFTLLGTPHDGDPPRYIGGMRGLVERNTMRYYLAIEAYLGSLSIPQADQAQWRFEHWFDATEHYPRQLHEIDRATYLEMKRNEYRRQQAAP
ncbi:MAG: hypothetical protein ACREWJ_05990 [Rhodoferax sp.]